MVKQLRPKWASVILARMFEFQTAGESHGPALVVVVRGLPADLPVDFDFLGQELRRRQAGYGRGGRMKIEQDQARILSGVRHGRTLGSPISLLIENRDFANWSDVMSVTEVADDVAAKKKVTRPRPGHADLAGALKYNQKDARNILERSSARETAARVAAGALAKMLLRHFSIDVLSHTTAIGSVSLPKDTCVTWAQLEHIRTDAVVRCAEPSTAEAMVAEIKNAQKEGDTVGGTFEVVARDVPVGLGAHVEWDRRLDGRLARAIMSINAVKAVEVGAGTRIAFERGSGVHDEIGYDPQRKSFVRFSNRAGGIEGGITNGEEIRVTGFLKPIPTLKKSLRSVDLASKEPFLAQHERSDTCAVPAAGVIGEAMVAIVLAGAFLEKFGGDWIGETRRNFDGYVNQVRGY